MIVLRDGFVLKYQSKILAAHFSDTPLFVFSPDSLIVSPYLITMACCSTQESGDTTFEAEWSSSTSREGLRLHQLETALLASHQREEVLKQLVEQQRTEIDKLRSLVNSLQLQESLRSLAVTPPSRRPRQADSAIVSPASFCGQRYSTERPDELDLGPSLKRLRIDD